MNKLLPKKEELKPILDSTNTFYDTPFNKEFDLLEFKDKLQIINDIVRQTMIFSKTPNVLEDVETLIGDSYTAALASIEYLKSINLGKNYKVAFAYKKTYETDRIASTSIVLLVDDENNNTYVFDATPTVGYKVGKVCLKSQNIYNSYILIEGNLKETYENLRFFNSLIHKRILTKDELDELFELLNTALNYEIFNECVNNIILYMKKIYPTKNLKTNIIQTPNEDDIIKLLKQKNIWYEELKELILSDKDYARQIELSQCIMNVINYVNHSEGKICDLGEKYLMSNISPRLLLEKDLNLVIIKPSAYIFGWEDIVRNSFINDDIEPIGEYNQSFGNKTSLGLKPMHLFHPHGYMYERAMSGTTSLFFVKRKADEIGTIKKSLRKELKQLVLDKEVMWFDGETITWNPICLNFAHTSDNPSEACMGYSCNYPEYQLMTRFMYPNPELTKEEKRERIRI